MSLHLYSIFCNNLLSTILGQENSARKMPTIVKAFFSAWPCNSLRNFFISIIEGNA